MSLLINKAGLQNVAWTMTWIWTSLTSLNWIRCSLTEAEVYLPENWQWKQSHAWASWPQKRKPRLCLSLPSFFSQLPEMSRPPSWKVNEGMGEKKATSTAKRAEIPALLTKLRRRGEGVGAYLLSPNRWSDRSACGPHAVVVAHLGACDGGCRRGHCIAVRSRSQCSFRTSCVLFSQWLTRSEPWFLHLSRRLPPFLLVKVQGILC